MDRLIACVSCCYVFLNCALMAMDMANLDDGLCMCALFLLSCSVCLTCVLMAIDLAKLDDRRCSCAYLFAW